MIVEICLETQLFNNKDNESQILESILSKFGINKESLNKEEINNLIYNDNDTHKFNIDEFKSKIKDIQKIDDDLIYLIGHLFALNPNKRFTAKEVLMSNYLKNYPGNDSFVLSKMGIPMDYKLLMENMVEGDFEENLQNLIKIS
jgi:hypothetical protein